MELTGAAARLLKEPNFASFSTLMPDGSPHVSRVWIDLEGDLIYINTADGRVKLKNASRDPRVALCVYDSKDPNKGVAIRGRVVDITKEGANQHIDKMSKKYLNLDKYPWHQPGVQRVLIKIEPLFVSD